MPSLDHVVWIGGAQWAGKTSVAQALAIRCGLLHYSYDYHDARAHLTKAAADPERYPSRALIAQGVEDGTFAERWVEWSGEQLADDTRQSFVERFEMVRDEIATLPGDPYVVAEGVGIRPELVAPHLDDPRRAVFLVPSEEFRMQQVQALPRAGRLGAELSDPERGQQHRLERDRILADEVIWYAALAGLRVIPVDGSPPLNAIVEDIAEQFAPFVPHWLY
ncbi:MAG: hypothetical protein WCL53_01165 [Chloroflexota bacterium]